VPITKHRDTFDIAIDRPAVYEGVCGGSDDLCSSERGESITPSRMARCVALGRGSACDSLSSLLLRPYVQSTSSGDSLTVDMGWLLERMLEIIATPDVIEASAEEGQNLVNFDKRRYVTSNLFLNVITSFSFFH
jgi:hypothetical protein